MTRRHGTRARYVHGPGPGSGEGCHCEPCSAANRRYASYQAKRKRLEGLGRTDGPWASPFVTADPVRARLAELSALGIGYKRVAELAGVSKSSLLEVRAGRRARIRRHVSNRVLALPVDASQIADGQRVDAKETWRLVRKILTRKGWSKARISREIGQSGQALQLGRKQVTVGNARRVRALADHLGIDVVEPKFPVAPVLALDTIAGLARTTGIDARQFHRWKQAGIAASRADAVACALGMHPAELWGDWYEQVSA